MAAEDTHDSMGLPHAYLAHATVCISPHLQVPLWEHIPKEFKGDQVYKSFVHGWAQVLRAIQEVHSPMAMRHLRAPALPTVDAVTRELLQGSNRYDARYTSFFFSNGGRVEFALDGLLSAAEDSEEFDECYFGEDGDGHDEYDALPEHPLDECWAAVRYHFFGPKGKVPKGPFH